MPGWSPATIARRWVSPLLPPPGRHLLLALVNSIAFAFNHTHVSVMQPAVQQGHDASSVGKDFVSLFEGLVGRENHRLSFVTSVNDSWSKSADLSSNAE
jgi:hypothetical protein